MHLYLTKKRTEKVVGQSVRQLKILISRLALDFARNEFEKIYLTINLPSSTVIEQFFPINFSGVSETFHKLPHIPSPSVKSCRAEQAKLPPSQGSVSFHITWNVFRSDFFRRIVMRTRHERQELAVWVV